MNAPEQKKWDDLREDIRLLNSTPNKNGAPTWMIHDPIAGRFFRIGWLEFEMLKRWSTRNVKKIIEDIRRSTMLKPQLTDFVKMHKFLKSAHLLKSNTIEDTRFLLERQQQKKYGSLFSKSFKNYIFFRVTLIKPDNILEQTKSITDIFFKRSAQTLILFCTLAGLFLVIRDFDTFIGSLTILQSPNSLIAGFIALGVAKIVHECAHALTCKYYGCRVPGMGVAFILLWPILWTDTTDAWRLTSKKQRLAINAAGMIAEIALAGICSLLWALSPEGLFKDAMHMIAGIAWVMTLFVNLNPFMRFDGYYLLSDALEIPNLQSRSFDLAKNWIRTLLWGLAPKSEDHFEPHVKGWLIAYAFATWIYRFFLFLGIALMVYHFFFKALGITLMILEIWLFIVRPVIAEIQYWFKNKEQMKMPAPAKIISLTALMLILTVLFAPVSRTISATAIIKSAQEIPLIAPEAAKITALNIKTGQFVKKGDILFILKSPAIEKDIRALSLQQNMLQIDLNNKLVDPAFYRDALNIKEELKRTASSLKMKTAQSRELVIKSPIDGFIEDIPDYIKLNGWVSDNEHLGLIRSKKLQVETFIAEHQINRLQHNSTAKFITHVSLEAQNITLKSLDRSPADIIPYPELTAQNGGHITLQQSNKQITPKIRHYRVIFNLESNKEIRNTVIGTVLISAIPESLYKQFSRKITGVLIRESGF